MLNIGAVLDLYGVRYNPARTQQKVRCPVHDDRTPSMSVDLEKDVAKCHACNWGGNALQLIAVKEGINVREARQFATDHGIADRHDGGGDGDLSGVTFLGRRVAGGSRDRKRNSGYVPSWRRD